MHGLPTLHACTACPRLPSRALIPLGPCVLFSRACPLDASPLFHPPCSSPPASRSYDGAAPYKFSTIPTAWSEDGWARCVDGTTIAEALARAHTKARPNAKASGGEAGGEASGEASGEAGGEAGGEAALAGQSVLPNILTRQETLLLLASKRIKEMLVSTIARKQQRQLTRLWSDRVSRPEIFRNIPAPFTLSAADLKRALSMVKPFHLRKHGIDAQSTAWSRLCESGTLITSFGELSPGRCSQIETFLEDMLGTRADEGGGAGDGRTSREHELSRFVAFIRSHPGELWMNDRTTHEQLMMAVALSPQYTIVKRPSVEAAGPAHRHLAHAWTRTQPLYAISRAGDAAQVLVRPAGHSEVTHLQKAPNGPRHDAHGMGILEGFGSGDGKGGDGKGGDGKKGGRGGDAGTRDTHARGVAELLTAGGHLCIDIERVLVDADALNGASGALNGGHLPGEAPHEVAHDAHTSTGAKEPAQAEDGSSKKGGLRGGRWNKAARRTRLPFAVRPSTPTPAKVPPPSGATAGLIPSSQIARGGIEMWPALRLVYRPTFVPAIGAHIDLVQIGDQPDAVHLTAVTTRCAHPPLVAALCNLRLHLARALAPRAVDFTLTVSPRGEGTCLIALAPVAVLEVAKPGAGAPRGSLLNAATGEVVAAATSGAASVDASQAKGQLLLPAGGNEWKGAVASGEAAVRRLADLKRVPGARAEITRFLRACYGVRLEGGTGRCEDCAPPLFGKDDQKVQLFGVTNW